MRWWFARRYAFPNMPLDLGLASPPPSVFTTTFDSAQNVASITWRRGLRSEFFWSADQESDYCFLWERLPALAFPFDEDFQWIELFAWASEGADSPKNSVPRLLERGWSETNPVYGWLATPQSSSWFDPNNAFTVDTDGLVPEQQIKWLFRAAVRTRRNSRQTFTVSTPPGEFLPLKPVNIGPYRFDARSSVSPKKQPCWDDSEGFALDARPKNSVVEAHELVLRRAKRQQKLQSAGNSKK